MRSVAAALVDWYGRGPALLAMGCPCRELRTRRVCAACRPIGEALMPLTVPPSLLIVVEVLRPCFTAPWFATMSSLVTGALSASGPRTVTGMWQAAGLAGQAHWSRAHRFFARAVWDPDRVGLALARAVVASLAPDGAAVTVAVDDTLFHRYGRKVHGARYQHDGSARGRDGIGRGNCFVIVGIVAAVPFLARQVCLPALFRLHIPKTSASKTEQARAMVDLLARPCPGAPSTWWRRPASAGRPGAACPPASLHHPPGRQRGPAPTRTRAHRQARTPRLEGRTAGHRRRHGRHHCEGERVPGMPGTARMCREASSDWSDPRYHWPTALRLICRPDPEAPPGATSLTRDLIEPGARPHRSAVRGLAGACRPARHTSWKGTTWPPCHSPSAWSPSGSTATRTSTSPPRSTSSAASWVPPKRPRPCAATTSWSAGRRALARWSGLGSRAPAATPPGWPAGSPPTTTRSWRSTGPTGRPAGAMASPTRRRRGRRPLGPGRRRSHPAQDGHRHRGDAAGAAGRAPLGDEGPHPGRQPARQPAGHRTRPAPRAAARAGGRPAGAGRRRAATRRAHQPTGGHQARLASAGPPPPRWRPASQQRPVGDRHLPDELRSANQELRGAANHGRQVQERHHPLPYWWSIPPDFRRMWAHGVPGNGG